MQMHASHSIAGDKEVSLVRWEIRRKTIGKRLPSFGLAKRSANTPGGRHCTMQAVCSEQQMFAFLIIMHKSNTCEHCLHVLYDMVKIRDDLLVSGP